MSRLLVVEDDPATRLILRSRLGEHGHEILLAESGARGLVHAREARFDAILIGAAVTPALDGYELCRRLKSIPETRPTPVLLCADSTTHEARLRGFEAGCEAFVVGVELPTLELELSLALRRAQERRELELQLRAAREQLRRAGEERARPAPQPGVVAEGDGQAKECAEHQQALREIASGRPEGLLVVDAEGTVRQADRGASELLGGRIEGRHLGHLVPSSGLEAFVRDAHIEPREGFRFDLVPRRGRGTRSLSATVIPMMFHAGDPAGKLKLVLLYDSARRRLAAEALRVQEPGVPRQELGPLLEAARETFRSQSLCGESAALRQLRAAVDDASQRCEPVLIEGDRGTGKERVARTLHYGGSSTGAFGQMRCGSLLAESLEIELFGYTRGAFPGASVDRPGLFHCAQDGTLFLEEVSELPLEIQERLLAFLESGTIQRRGSARRSDRLDVRIVASTSRPLDAAVREGRFLEALLTRLSAIVLRVPPLAGRPEDVEPLVRHAIGCFGCARQVRTVSEEALAILQQHDWPGNVAELLDCIEQACARANAGRIEVADLPRTLREQHEAVHERSLLPLPPPSGRPALGTHVAAGSGRVEPSRPLRVPREMRVWDITDDDPINLDHYEKKALLRALEAAGQDRIRAAKLLGVGKSTLYRKLKRFNIH